jgi:thiol-disulfide isomerase/thioredoxin
MTEIFKKNRVKTVSVSDFKNGKLKVSGNSKPVMLMAYGDFCMHCQKAAPVFTKLKSDFLKVVLPVDELTPLESKLLTAATRGVYQGAVPSYVMYDKDGGFIGEYEHDLSEGCVRFEYLKSTGDIRTDLCK